LAEKASIRDTERRTPFVLSFEKAGDELITSLTSNFHQLRTVSMTMCPKGVYSLWPREKDFGFHLFSPWKKVGVDADFQPNIRFPAVKNA